MRDHLQKRGVIAQENHSFMTKHGRFDFSVGDQVIMTATDKRAGLINGQGGKVVSIDGSFITFESSKKESLSEKRSGHKLLTIDTSAFTGFRHGYAGTIYKGQGRTVDHAYIYHTSHWGQANSYVALSRHKGGAHLFVAGEYRDMDKLAKSLVSDDRKVTSLALELADKQSDDPNLGREFEKAFDLNAQGLNDTFEDALADMKQYRRVARQGKSRAYAYADYRAGIAAVEISNNAEASKEAAKRGLTRKISRQVVSTRSVLKSFKSARVLLAKSVKMLGAGLS
tara:strand:+ start:115 stop:963 length:849 start_codon:yes stop_codon:yes gene_type:complete